MSLEEYESESDNGLVQSMDYFSDEQLKNNIIEEDKLDQEEQRETECQNILGNVSQNKKNNNEENIENSGPNI